jgi:hypothetical protein
MKRFFLLFMLLSLPVGAQEIRGLDKEYYNAYLDSLPNEKKKRLETLKKNLLSMLKKVIPREDPDHGQSYAEKLTVESFQFEEISAQSPFVRGMIKEIPGLRPDKFMFVVKTGPYLVYVAFNVNPGQFITSESQQHVIIRAVDEGHPN